MHVPMLPDKVSFVPLFPSEDRHVPRSFVGTLRPIVNSYLIHFLAFQQAAEEYSDEICVES